MGPPPPRPPRYDMTTRVLSAPRVLRGLDAKRERGNWLLPPLLLRVERRRLPRQAEEWKSIRVAAVAPTKRGFSPGGLRVDAFGEKERWFVGWAD